MIQKHRLTVFLLVVVMLALANWACCGTTSPSQDFSDAKITTSAVSDSTEDGPVPGVPTVGPTHTPTPLVPTVDTSECSLGASFQADITIPDNTSVGAGKTFVKTWSIRNTGTCDWGPGYRLSFTEGEQMGGPESVSVPGTPAGESAEVSIELVAPVEGGQHRGNWQMCVNEECFGETIYVQIVSVPPPTPTLDADELAATDTVEEASDLVETVEAYRELPPIGTWGEPGRYTTVVVGDFRYTYSIGYTSASTGARFVAFGVRVDNTSFSDVFVSPLHFTVVDFEGRTYTYHSTTFTYWAMPLETTTVLPGNNVQGGLVFYMPSDTGPMAVAYDDGFDTVIVDLTTPPLE